MAEEDSIPARLANVRQRIAAACETWGRDPSCVHLLAVSKTKPASMIEEALAAGQRDFGENYLQEALEKIEAVPGSDIAWHFIGDIQSNKTRPIAERFDWVHTVNRARIARRLSDQRPAELPPLKVLLQVNISDEASKAGVTPAETPDLVAAVLACPRLELRGLMAIPAAETAFERQRAQFRALADLATDLRASFGDSLPHFEDLSMGMTGDMEAAIAEGSTWVRIGTAIFGPRNREKPA